MRSFAHIAVRSWGKRLRRLFRGRQHPPTSLCVASSYCLLLFFYWWSFCFWEATGSVVNCGVTKDLRLHCPMRNRCPPPRPWWNIICRSEAGGKIWRVSKFACGMAMSCFTPANPVAMAKPPFSCHSGRDTTSPCPLYRKNTTTPLMMSAFSSRKAPKNCWLRWRIRCYPIPSR